MVVIDNLDRCLPKNAIQTMEAIRLFLFLPNTAFVIAADEEMIRGAVAEHFKGSSERHQMDYLDKLIQVPIHVPKSGVREIRAYLFMLFAEEHGVPYEVREQLRLGLENSLKESWKQDPIGREEALSLIDASQNYPDLIDAFDLADRIAPILAASPAIQGNPRIVKRMLNVVRMRTKVARRRNMPLDEGIITKLVIFERCAGAKATADLYHLIDTENGTPKVLEVIENIGDGDELIELPETWTKSVLTSDFIKKWAKIRPLLQGVDLRAAIYLSRETMPLGAYITGLSSQASDALKALIEADSISSPAANEGLTALSQDEESLVMEEIVNHLRHITDWIKKPKGFTGACLLARESEKGAVVLQRFISKAIESKPPWMTQMLKKENWYKE